MMLERALDAGVPAGWVTADEAYGGDPALRRWLEGRGLSYVLAVKCTELLAMPGPDRLVGASATQLAAGVPAERWVTASAGQDAKGSRLYDWARVDLAAPAGVGAARWLLVRRRRGDGGLAFYACFGRLAPRCSGWSGWPGAAGRSRRLRAGQGRGRPGPLRGASLAGLVPAHHQATSDPATRGDAAA